MSNTHYISKKYINLDPVLHTFDLHMPASHDALSKSSRRSETLQRS